MMVKKLLLQLFVPKMSVHENSCDKSLQTITFLVTVCSHKKRSCFRRLDMIARKGTQPKARKLMAQLDNKHSVRIGGAIDVRLIPGSALPYTDRLSSRAFGGWTENIACRGIKITTSQLRGCSNRSHYHTFMKCFIKCFMTFNDNDTCRHGMS